MLLPQEPDLIIEKDIQGVIRELRHLQTPAKSEPGHSARLAALEYLNLAALERGLLPLEQDDWNHLRDTINSDGPDRSPKSGYRWAPSRELKRNSAIETTIVWCQQTALVRHKDPNDPKASKGPKGPKPDGIVADIQGSSIRLVVHHKPLPAGAQITSVRLTTIQHAKLSIEAGDVARAFGRLNPSWVDDFPADLVSSLLAPFIGIPDLDEILEARLVAYPRLGESKVYGDSTLGLAISATIYFPVASGDPIAHRILFDPLEEKLLHKAPIASACAGYAFLNDPDSKTGGFALRPHSRADLLNPQRDPVSLLDLDHDGGGRRKLTGARIAVRQKSALGDEYNPPVQAPPFAFSARTNEFAAVSAYFHCDSMVSLIEGFGFPLCDRCNNRAMSLTVEHRAKMLSGSGARDGRGINAYVTPFKSKKTEPLDVKMLFGLADFADSWRHPLGLAADVRFVWHEFCHVLILAATGSTEFNFAHSAGDALAAIMCDPSSRLPASYRGVTFPFIQLPLRQHDRKVGDGWGWNGTRYERPRPTYGLRDPAGYNAEQILSSTLFRLYCAFGGDAVRRNAAGEWEADRERRAAAANYCAYLIVRAIASLGHIDTQPTSEASQFATAMMDADVGTPYLDYEGSKQLGGMLHKVVRWAFEQQGLYQVARPGTRNEPGRPPAIDIYVDNRRAGTYAYDPKWHALRRALFVRHQADGHTPGQHPRPGRVNYVYLVLRNRGDQPALAASVDIFAATGNAVETWDVAQGYWQKLQGNNTTHDVRSGHAVKFGPFAWTPQAGTRNALLVRSTVAGDQSNIDDGSDLPCAVGPVLVADLVRADNNLGYREWTLP
jgi:hypothetical protein